MSEAAAIERDRLRQDAARIEELLGELQSMIGAPAWQRLEELVQALVGLYGAGIARLVELAAATGDGGRLTGQLCADELVSSLLVLHGLHPKSPAERAESALAALGRELGTRLQLVAVDDGVATVRASGAAVSAAAIERAVRDAAPELSRVLLEQQSAAAPPLVQIDLRRSRRSR